MLFHKKTLMKDLWVLDTHISKDKINPLATTSATTTNQLQQIKLTLQKGAFLNNAFTKMNYTFFIKGKS